MDKRNPVLADILLMKTEADRAWARGIAGNRSVKCPKCGKDAVGLYYDWEVYSQFLEEPMCECGWIEDRKVPYPRNGD